MPEGCTYHNSIITKVQFFKLDLNAGFVPGDVLGGCSSRQIKNTIRPPLDENDSRARRWTRYAELFSPQYPSVRNIFCCSTPVTLIPFVVFPGCVHKSFDAAHRSQWKPEEHRIHATHLLPSPWRVYVCDVLLCV